MAIKKGTIKEKDKNTGTIYEMYPKTSIDQVENLSSSLSYINPKVVIITYSQIVSTTPLIINPTSEQKTILEDLNNTLIKLDLSSIYLIIGLDSPYAWIRRNSVKMLSGTSASDYAETYEFDCEANALNSSAEMYKMGKIMALYVNSVVGSTYSTYNKKLLVTKGDYFTSLQERVNNIEAALTGPNGWVVRSISDLQSGKLDKIGGNFNSAFNGYWASDVSIKAGQGNVYLGSDEGGSVTLEGSSINVASPFATNNIGTTQNPLYSAIAIKSKDYSTSDDILHISVDGGSAKSWSKTLAIDGSVYSSRNFSVEGYLNIGGSEQMPNSWVGKFGGDLYTEGVIYCKNGIFPGTQARQYYSANLGSTTNPWLNAYIDNIGKGTDIAKTSEIIYDECGYKPMGHTYVSLNNLGHQENINITVFYHPVKNKYKTVLDILRPGLTNLTHGTIKFLASTIGHKWFTNTNEDHIHINAGLNTTEATALFNSLGISKPTLSSYYAQLEKQSGVLSKSSSDPNSVYNLNGDGSFMSTLGNSSSGGAMWTQFMAVELDTDYNGSLYLHDWHIQIVWYEK